MLQELLAFVAVSAVVICTPGQDTALTIRNTLAGGRRHSLLRAFRRGELADATRPGAPLARRRALRQGVLSNLGHPKMAVFFATLLPQFVPPAGTRSASCSPEASCSAR